MLYIAIKAGSSVLSIHFVNCLSYYYSTLFS